MKDQFWTMKTSKYSDYVVTCAEFEIRSEIALRMLEKWGAVAGKNGGADSTGRAFLDLQPPEEFVARCFKIADLFVDTAIERGELRSRVEAKNAD